MATRAMDLCLTFKLGDTEALQAREGHYPPITKDRRLVLTDQIARMDRVTIDEAHRQIHEQLRVW